MDEQDTTIETGEMLKRLAKVGADVPRTTLKHWIREGLITRPESRGRYARYPLRALGEIGLVWRLRALGEAGVMSVTSTGIKEALAFVRDLQLHWSLGQRWQSVAIIPGYEVPITIWGGSPSRAEVLVTGACAFFKAMAGIDLLRPVKLVFHWICLGPAQMGEQPPEHLRWVRDVVSILESSDDAIQSVALRDPGMERFVAHNPKPVVLAEVSFGP